MSEYTPSGDEHWKARAEAAEAQVAAIREQRKSLPDVRCPECGHAIDASNDHADWCRSTPSQFALLGDLPAQVAALAAEIAGRDQERQMFLRELAERDSVLARRAASLQSAVDRAKALADEEIPVPQSPPIDHRVTDVAGWRVGWVSGYTSARAELRAALSVPVLPEEG